MSHWRSCRTLSRKNVQNKRHEIWTLPNGMGRVDWIERKSLEVPSCERQGDVRWQRVPQRTSKAVECKWNSDASPIEFFCRTWQEATCGGDSRIGLWKIVQLREVEGDDAKEFQKIVQTLFVLQDKSELAQLVRARDCSSVGRRFDSAKNWELKSTWIWATQTPNLS